MSFLQVLLPAKVEYQRLKVSRNDGKIIWESKNVIQTHTLHLREAPFPADVPFSLTSTIRRPFPWFFCFLLRHIRHLELWVFRRRSLLIQTALS
jgi:hypothetical protein